MMASCSASSILDGISYVRSAAVGSYGRGTSRGTGQLVDFLFDLLVQLCVFSVDSVAVFGSPPVLEVHEVASVAADRANELLPSRRFQPRVRRGV